ncbi:MAG: hypothetical protein AUG48_00410 [Actinobacteria bacterium 13_1_20CM_3_68_9]|jgi:hypothetical protein|nr:MAG: hypothetical protein AUG48_00410 [Actinobacteria bacterium 13_1_20CM_3_68_9]
MELATQEEEIVADLTMGGAPAAGGRGRCPIENPAIDPIPNDPLREPHPGEPGVKPDGTASPLENPG